jgi:hypothetical protein
MQITYVVLCVQDLKIQTNAVHNLSLHLDIFRHIAKQLWKATIFIRYVFV